MTATFTSPKFEVLAEIGRGGMGLVYKVRHVALDTVMAVKVLSPELAGDAEFAARFEREARVMARLKHNNIVRVVDIDAHEGVRFIVMEYVAGSDLRDVLRQRGTLKVLEALLIAEQVARGLDYAHTTAGGVIHRDIKPSNIIVEEGSGRAVVTDFGIARVMEATTEMTGSRFMGTLRYTAPEQIKGERIDGRVDVYGLGLVLYEMLTDLAAFRNLDAGQIVARLLDPHETPLEFPPSVPPAVQQLVLHATARDREQRFPTAAAFLLEIEQLRASMLAASNESPTVVMDMVTVTDPPWVLGLERPPPARKEPMSLRPEPAPVAVSPSAGAALPPVPVGAASVAPRPRRTLAVVGAMIAVSLVAVVAWWLGRTTNVRETEELPPAVAPTLAVVAPRAPAPPVLLPLTVARAEPAEEIVRAAAGERVGFVVEAAGAAPGELRYTWSVDGGEALAGTARHEGGPLAAGEHEIKAVVADSAGRSITRSWKVEWQPPVVAAAPAPAAVPPAAVPPAAQAPRLLPPRIENATPEKRQLSVAAGEAVEFRADAVEADGSPLALAWNVDGHPAGKQPTLRFEAPSAPRASTHTVAAEAVGRTGLRERATWRVAVAALPQAPRLVRVTPDDASLSIAAGRRRLVSVDAENPGAEDPVEGLSYEWRLDDVVQDGHGDRFELQLNDVGQHRLKVTVQGPSGATVSRDWRVDVLPSAEPLAVSAPKPPADLEILDLKDTVSKNKRTLLVEGKIRNRGEGVIERLVVMVEALDEDGEGISDADAVPAPQPLAPGEVATFRVRMDNNSKIRSFHVAAFPR